MNLHIYLSVKPFINREKMQNITVRAGQSVKFDVDVKGEPAPTTTWVFAGAELQSGLRIKIDNQEYNTKLAITDATRKNKGTYTLRAENVNGMDEATVDVIVLGLYVEYPGFYTKFKIVRTILCFQISEIKYDMLFF